jgi:hypothetical protein
MRINIPNISNLNFAGPVSANDISNVVNITAKGMRNKASRESQRGDSLTIECVKGYTAYT